MKPWREAIKPGRKLVEQELGHTSGQVLGILPGRFWGILPGRYWGILPGRFWLGFYNNLRRRMAGKKLIFFR